MGEFTEKVKGNANEAAGELKQKSDNPETRAEGQNQEAKGKADLNISGHTARPPPPFRAR